MTPCKYCGTQLDDDGREHILGGRLMHTATACRELTFKQLDASRAKIKEISYIKQHHWMLYPLLGGGYVMAPDSARMIGVYEDTRPIVLRSIDAVIKFREWANILVSECQLTEEDIEKRIAER